MKKSMRISIVAVAATTAIAASAVGAFAGGQSTRMSDDEVKTKVVAAVQGEDARSDRAQATAVEETRMQVKQTMRRRADRRADRARKAGYESGSSDGYASGSTDGYASGNADGYASGEATGEADGYGEGYADGSYDSYDSGGFADGSYDSAGYATGEGCSDNPDTPLPFC